LETASGPKGSSLSYLEYSARREIAIALSENGYPVESSIAQVVNSQPGEAMLRTGTKDNWYLFTDQYTGKQFALDMDKAMWLEEILTETITRSNRTIRRFLIEKTK